jgi:hypothetical protein
MAKKRTANGVCNNPTDVDVSEIGSASIIVFALQLDNRVLPERM